MKPINMLKQGFSLIEMMFVIVLIGIITAISVSALRGKVNDDTLQKAASDMELILQADQSYYTDNQKAPKSMSDLSTYLTLPIKGNNIYNPWGYTYDVMQASKDSGKLQIITTAPNSATANKLAALIPGGICNSSNCSDRKVVASIPVNIGDHMKENEFKIFWPNPGASSELDVKKIDCPSGYTAKVIANLPHWGGDFSNYYVTPKMYEDTTAHPFTGKRAYPITNFVPVVGDDKADDLWTINIWYVLSWNPEHGPDDKADYGQLSTGGASGKGIGKKDTNTPFMTDRFRIGDYTGHVMVGLNRADKTANPNNSWYGAVNCGSNPLRSNTSSCPSSPWSPTTTGMNNGQIGKLKVIQWCQKNTT